jgi:hypothetical protein
MDVSERGDTAWDVTTRPSVTIRRIEIGGAETLVWVIVAIAVPLSPFLPAVGGALLALLGPILSYPSVAGLGLLVVLGLLTWAAKVGPSGTSVRAWIVGAWFAGTVAVLVLMFIGIRMLPYSFYFFIPMIAIAAWVLVGVVVSPLAMLGVIALATRRFVIRLQAEA